MPSAFNLPGGKVNFVVLAVIVSCLLLLVTSDGIATQPPVCQSAVSDSDGDGWGWENNQSCVIAQSPADRQAPGGRPVCQAAGSDPDGDGWGWENNQSCKMPEAGANTATTPARAGQHPVCSSDRSDPDGDGYGWENDASCLVRQPVAPNDNSESIASGRMTTDLLPVCRLPASDRDGDGLGWEDNDLCITEHGLPACDNRSADPDHDGIGVQHGRSCLITGFQQPKPAGQAGPAAHGADDAGLSPAAITDVVLVTGQSNVLGSMTGYDRALDHPHERVFAWTDQGWQMADLHQVWDRNGHPGNQSLRNPARQPYNSFPFHFGKALASQATDRVVAFIVLSAPGMGIGHWDRNGPFYPRLTRKVSAALQALPHRSKVDAILWHQGETDWQYEGTSDVRATDLGASAEQRRNYYPRKLRSLIANLRSESWAEGEKTAFICGETRPAKGVNQRLMALNHDADSLTGCVAASDLPARADDPSGSHFSARGLRTLGARYAQLYLQLKPLRSAH